MMRYLTTTLWQNRDMFLLGIIIGMVSVMLAGCTNIDVNGYHAKGGSTGKYACAGACQP